jgi:hypothetical protein
MKFFIIFFLLFLSFGCQVEDPYPDIIVDINFSQEDFEEINAAAEEWFFYFPSLRKPVRAREPGERTTIKKLTRIEDLEAYNPKIHSPTTLGLADGHRHPQMLLFRDKIQEYQEKRGGNQFYLTVLHEFGHYFGAPHLDSGSNLKDPKRPQAVMNTYRNSNYLTDLDLQGMCQARKGLPECD